MNVDAWCYLQKESQAAFSAGRTAIVSFDFERDGKLAETVSYGINEKGEIRKLWWPRQFGIRYLIKDIPEQNINPK